MSEMDEIVKYLRGIPGGMSEEDIQAYIDKLREASAVEEKKEEKREEPKFVLNERAATVVWPNGFSCSFDKQGNVQWAYDGKRLTTDLEAPETPILSQHDVELCLRHIIGLHEKERKELWNAVKHYKDAAEHAKVRYMNKSHKKAFVAGMILGKKEAG